jgi:filamentous hemagglutinin
METILNKEGRTVTSTTLPPKNMPNVSKAGLHKERTIVINAETGETAVQRVVFDQRGFPDFSPYMKYETRIGGDLGKMASDAHKRAATRSLYADIQAGRVDGKMFNNAQMKQIEHGRKRIDGYIWHHHQDPGRMQLIPEDVHVGVGHTGGDAMWGTIPNLQNLVQPGTTRWSRGKEPYQVYRPNLAPDHD